MSTTLSTHDARWADMASEALRYDGYAVVSDVLDALFLEKCKVALYRAREGIYAEVGKDRLDRAGELGTLRLPMRFDPFFFEFLRLPDVLTMVDRTIGDTAILHQMNAFILPSLDAGATPSTYQNSFHRDFPRLLGGHVASFNVFFAIDRFTVENGATMVVPGTHQRSNVPDLDYLNGRAVPIEAPAGAMLLFDSTLWHCAGRNVSGSDRLAVNLQFTHSFIKQQVDYVRALGDEVVLERPDRTQQLLGWYTRVVTSLDEYYRPESDRLYRKGQG